MTKESFCILVDICVKLPWPQILVGLTFCQSKPWSLLEISSLKADMFLAAESRILLHHSNGDVIHFSPVLHSVST